ncbi:unnamed protein product [Haemonchus placei]|uniref:Uncharacterized protein n=1 Tax=Haemonchus placei TaxID=6290 RepID=A0A0N4WPR3_HAEPC|nr:unnamed protein product [Haemonchus placei]
MRKFTSLRMTIPFGNLTCASWMIPFSDGEKSCIRPSFQVFRGVVES